MKPEATQQELLAILHDYDWGLEPDSIEIINDTSQPQVAFTLLESIRVNITVTNRGFQVLSVKEKLKDRATVEELFVKKYIMCVFESIESLLMTLSPAFKVKHQEMLFDKLLSLQQTSENH